MKAMKSMKEAVVSPNGQETTVRLFYFILFSKAAHEAPKF